MYGGFFAKTELQRLLWMFKGDFWRVILLSFFANLLLLAPTLYMLQIYDRVLVSRNELTLIFVSILLVFFLVAMVFAERLRSSLLVQIGTEMDYTLASPLFRASFVSALQKIRKDSGSALSDLVTIRQFLTGNGMLSIIDLPWSLVFICVMFFLHPLIGVLGIAFAFVQLLLMVVNKGVVDGITKEAAKASSESAVYVELKLRNSESIHAMGMTQHLQHRWNAIQETALAANKAAFAKQNQRQSISKFVRYSMQSFTLGFAGFLVIQGQLSPGAMIAANILMARSLQPLDNLVNTWQQMLQARLAFDKIESLLISNPAQVFNTVEQEPQGMIELRHLSAKAEGRGTPILNDISLQIPAGSVVAVIGASGSGKSTFARCLVGVWPSIDGSVLLDGNVLAEIDPRQLGRYVGYVPQDIELLDGTIAENIARFGDVDAHKVVDAAKKTGVHDMILHFSKGFDTQIGQDSSELSAGQRQRVALARALYGNPSLLVLDEPNANLDDAGDALFLRTLAALKQEKKTVILISHRMNILSIADFILVLDKGNTVRFGSKESVLAFLQAKKAAVQVVSVV